MKPPNDGVILIASQMFPIDISDLKRGLQTRLYPGSCAREVVRHHLDTPAHLHGITLPLPLLLRRHIEQFVEVVLPEWCDLSGTSTKSTQQTVENSDAAAYRVCLFRGLKRHVGCSLYLGGQEWPHRLPARNIEIDLFV